MSVTQQFLCETNSSKKATGTLKRYCRSCDNPAPRGSGAACNGTGLESRACNAQVTHNKNDFLPLWYFYYNGALFATQFGHPIQITCPVDGAWSTWGSFSACSRTCGGGNRTRERTCTDPAPAGDGAQCQGTALEVEGRDFPRRPNRNASSKSILHVTNLTFFNKFGPLKKVLPRSLLSELIFYYCA